MILRTLFHVFLLVGLCASLAAQADRCPDLIIDSTYCGTNDDEFFINFRVMGTGDSTWQEILSGITDEYGADSVYTAGPFPTNRLIPLALTDTKTDDCESRITRVPPPAACTRVDDCAEFRFAQLPPPSTRCDTNGVLDFRLTIPADFTAFLITPDGDTLETATGDSGQGFQFDAPPYGRYRVVVVRADGCTIEDEIVMGLDCGCGDFLVAFTESSGSCADTGATVIATVFGRDTEGLSFQWNNGQMSDTLTGALIGEVYAVTITDETGCETVARTQVLGVNDAQFLLDNLRQEGDCNTDSLVLTVPPVFQDFNVEWTQEGTGLVQEGPRAVFYEGGDITIMVSSPDNRSCSFSALYRFERPEIGEERSLVFEASDTVGCLPVGCIGIQGDIVALVTGEVRFQWISPSGPLRPDSLDQSIFFGIRLCDPEPGLHRVVIGTDCGLDTLSYLYAPVETATCGNVSGTVFLNEQEDCDRQDGEIGVTKTVVEFTDLTTQERFYTLTDGNGGYVMRLPEGSYSVAIPNPPVGTALEDCVDQRIDVAEATPSVKDLPLSVSNACPQLTTSLSLTRVRRCFENRFSVAYENRGTGAAAGAVLTVELDAFMDSVRISGSDRRVGRNGNTLTIPLGDLPPFATGQLQFDYVLSCEANLGQVHCLEATIGPDFDCNAANSWDGALIRVDEAGCDGDSLTFRIQNVGTRTTSKPVNYVIVEDGVMLRQRNGSMSTLAPGELRDLVLPANGSTYQLIAEQEANAPASPRPSAVTEGCGTDEGGNFSTGFANVISSGNGLPSQTRVCRENIGSYDPNEKIGLPYGLGVTGDVEPGTRMRYDLYFQNTGTDTAFTVVIRDTLSTDLDLCTIEFGASSHSYTASVDSGRVVTFTFDNILLPDSSTNLLGSQGVVSFTLDHDPTLDRGDEFQNRAGIFFDFNDAIITEYARHRLAVLDLLSSTDRGRFVPDVDVRLAPNPVSDRLKIELAGLRNGEAVNYRILDVMGREHRLITGRGARAKLDVSGLPRGSYLLSVEAADGRIRSVNRFVVVR